MILVILILIILPILICYLIYQLVITPVKTGNKKIKSSEKIEGGFGPFSLKIEDKPKHKK